MCECGKEGHQDQIETFPVGATVVAIRPIYEYLGILPIGTVGIVAGHTDDGRATVEFGARRAVHTFHFPEGYIARAYP